MQIIINKWRLDTSLNALIHCETGEIQRLGEFHFILLETFIQHAGEVLPRAWLINEVWKNRVVGNNSLPTAIYALRVALGDDGRVQEIIKTVPKKGYVFNKDFITERADDDAENTGAGEAVLFNPASAPVSDDTPDAVAESPPLPDGSEPVAPVKKASRRTKSLLLIFTLLLAAGISWGLMKGFHREIPVANNDVTNPDTLLLHEEKNLETNRIALFHLRRNNDEIHASQLTAHIPAHLKKINALLETKQASLTLYYYTTMPRLSLSLLITDRCKQQNQLIMGIQNWQRSADELGSLVYQEVERTLNEMPVCQ